MIYSISKFIKNQLCIHAMQNALKGFELPYDIDSQNQDINFLDC